MLQAPNCKASMTINHACKRHQNLEAFVEDRVTQTEAGCWRWNRGGGPGGYAQTTFRGKRRLVHRVTAFFCLGLDLDDASQIVDHICRNKKCCNPAHLRIVSQRENVHAPGSLAVAKQRAEKTNCPKCNGEYTTYTPKWLKGKAVRRCVPCDTAYKAEWAARKKNALHAKREPA